MPRQVPARLWRLRFLSFRDSRSTPMAYSRWFSHLLGEFIRDLHLNASYSKQLPRELAFQISEQFAVLGSSFNLRTAVVVGGMDIISQALELGNRPHVVVATPGRLVDLLRSNSGEWDLSRVKFLVRPLASVRLVVFLILTRFSTKRIGFLRLPLPLNYRTYSKPSRRNVRRACSQLPGLRQ